MPVHSRAEPSRMSCLGGALAGVLAGVKLFEVFSPTPSYAISWRGETFRVSYSGDSSRACLPECNWFEKQSPHPYAPPLPLSVTPHTALLPSLPPTVSHTSTRNVPLFLQGRVMYDLLVHLPTTAAAQSMDGELTRPLPHSHTMHTHAHTPVIHTRAKPPTPLSPLIKGRVMYDLLVYLPTTAGVQSKDGTGAPTEMLLEVDESGVDVLCAHLKKYGSTLC